MVVGLSVDLLSPACVSHQGLLGNPNLTVAQIMWILHILPHIGPILPIRPHRAYFAYKIH